MPYDINWEKNGVFVKFNGIFNYETNYNANLEIYNDSNFCNLKYVIWDLSKVTEVDITENEVNIMAMQDKFVSLRLPEVKTAILVMDKRFRDLCYQYVAHCQNIFKGWTFMVSDNIENIRAWVTS